MTILNYLVRYTGLVHDNLHLVQNRSIQSLLWLFFSFETSSSRFSFHNQHPSDGCIQEASWYLCPFQRSALHWTHQKSLPMFTWIESCDLDDDASLRQMINRDTVCIILHKLLVGSTYQMNGKFYWNNRSIMKMLVMNMMNNLFVMVWYLMVQVEGMKCCVPYLSGMHNYKNRLLFTIEKIKLTCYLRLCVVSSSIEDCH